MILQNGPASNKNNIFIYKIVMQRSLELLWRAGRTNLHEKVYPMEIRPSVPLSQVPFNINAFSNRCLNGSSLLSDL